MGNIETQQTENEDVKNTMNNTMNVNNNNMMNSNPPFLAYPPNLINVNSGSSLQPPLQLKPPFIPLSTVPQYYMLNNTQNNTDNNASPLLPSNQLSQLFQLPHHIQLQLMQQGLPQNTLILPIDQIQNFKKVLQANKHNLNGTNIINNNNNISNLNNNSPINLNQSSQESSNNNIKQNSYRGNNGDNNKIYDNDKNRNRNNYRKHYN